MKETRWVKANISRTGTKGGVFPRGGNGFVQKHGQNELSGKETHMNRESEGDKGRKKGGAPI